MKPHLTKVSERKEESKPTLFMQWLLQNSLLESPLSRQVLRAVLSFAFLAHVNFQQQQHLWL